MYRWWHFQFQLSFRDFVIVDPFGSSFEKWYFYILRSYSHFGSRFHSERKKKCVTINPMTLNLLNLQSLFCRNLWIHFRVGILKSVVVFEFWGLTFQNWLNRVVCFCACLGCVMCLSGMVLACTAGLFIFWLQYWEG